MKKNSKYLAVTISVSDIEKKYIQENIIIKVYRVPVIWSMAFGPIQMIRGKYGFKRFLEGRGFCVMMVDYKEYNAKTFDPCAEPEIGNPAMCTQIENTGSIGQIQTATYISFQSGYHCP